MSSVEQTMLDARAILTSKYCSGLWWPNVHFCVTFLLKCDLPLSSPLLEYLSNSWKQSSLCWWCQGLPIDNPDTFGKCCCFWCFLSTWLLWVANTMTISMSVATACLYQRWHCVSCYAQSVTANPMQQCKVCQQTSNSQNLTISTAIGSGFSAEPIAVCSLGSLISVQVYT